MKQSAMKQTIIETASKLFYQNGYNLTGINEIIREAGIAKATLYSHFKSKEDICIAYLEHKNDSFIEEIRAFILKRKSGEAQLIALFEFLEIFYAQKEFNGCWCINTISEIPRDNNNIRSKIQEQKKDFLTLIDRLVKTNLSHKTTIEKELIAKHIYVLYEGALAESHLHQDPWPIASAKEMCKQLIV